MSSKQMNTDLGRVKRLVGWSFPYLGWIKVNSDGAVKGNPSLVGAGR